MPYTTQQIRDWIANRLPHDQRDEFEAQLLWDRELQQALEKVERVDRLRLRAMAGLRYSVAMAAGVVLCLTLLHEPLTHFFGKPTVVVQEMRLAQLRSSAPRPQALIALNPETTHVVATIDIGQGDGEILLSISPWDAEDDKPMWQDHFPIAAGISQAHIPANILSPNTYKAIVETNAPPLGARRVPFLFLVEPAAPTTD